MTIFVWKEVYVVGQVDADFSGKSDDSESDNVKRRDRRGYIDTILNPAHLSRIMNPNLLKKWSG